MTNPRDHLEPARRNLLRAAVFNSPQPDFEPTGGDPPEGSMRNPTRFQLLAASALALAFALASVAHADGDSPRARRLERRGDRVEERLDRRGDRIETAAGRRGDQLERRGDRIERRLERRGGRVDARLDRRGERIDVRLDRRADRLGERRGRIDTAAPTHDAHSASRGGRLERGRPAGRPVGDLD